MATFSWLNGQKDYHICKDDRALHFGDGVFETLLITSQHIRFLDLHLKRLEKSLLRLNISLSIDTIKADLELALGTLAYQKMPHAWRLKYIVSRGNSQTAYAYKSDITANRLMLLQPFTRDVETLQQQGGEVVLCDWPLSQHPILAGIKHLNRLDQVMGRAQWQEEHIVEGLMSDQQGRLIEGTMSNLFVVDKHGRLITAPLDQCGVEGVMRQAIIERFAPVLGLECVQMHLPRLHDVVEIFISNALMGIVPVTQCDQLSFKIGAVTRELQQQLQQNISLK